MDTSAIENFITITDMNFMHSVMSKLNYFIRFVARSRQLTELYFVASHSFTHSRNPATPILCGVHGARLLRLITSLNLITCVLINSFQYQFSSFSNLRFSISYYQKYLYIHTNGHDFAPWRSKARPPWEREPKHFFPQMHSLQQQLRNFIRIHFLWKNPLFSISHSLLGFILVLLFYFLSKQSTRKRY